MNKNKILVTGAAGFIGFHISKRLCNEGWEVHGLDNMNSYYDPKVKEARLNWNSGVSEVGDQIN